MPTFKVKDLMINVIPKARGGSGSVFLPADDGPIPTPVTPHTPVISVAKMTPQLQRVRTIVEQVDLAALDNLALQVGRAAIGGAFLCTQDMATCAANPRISPLASQRDTLVLDDLPLIRVQLNELMEQVQQVEAGIEERTIREADELVPRLREALDFLESRR